MYTPKRNHITFSVDRLLSDVGNHSGKHAVHKNSGGLYSNSANVTLESLDNYNTETITSSTQCLEYQKNDFTKNNDTNVVQIKRPLPLRVQPTKTGMNEKSAVQISPSNNEFGETQLHTLIEQSSNLHHYLLQDFHDSDSKTFQLRSSSSSKKGKRSWSRAVFSNLQKKGLEKTFQKQKYITNPDRKRLAANLGLHDSQVKVWFQNRRMKWRKAIKPCTSEDSTNEKNNKDAEHSCEEFSDESTSDEDVIID